MYEPPPEPAPAAPSRAGLALPLHPVWLTKAILLFNILMFLLLSFYSRGGFMEAVLGGANGEALILLGAKVNPLIRAGQYWRLLTPIFLHIGLVHLIFNEYALSIFGREVESLFGPWRFLALYLLTGMFGTLASFAFSPALSAGASGAIFGILGAMIAFLLRNRKLLGERGREHIRALLTMIAINVFLGFTIPGIDNYGHMGGLVSGLLLGALLSPTYAVEPLTVPPFATVVERPTLLPTSVVTALALALLGGATMLIIQLGA